MQVDISYVMMVPKSVLFSYPLFAIPTFSMMYISMVCSTINRRLSQCNVKARTVP